MKMKNSLSFLLGGAAALLLVAFFRSPGQVAGAQEGRQPFASSIEQRGEMVAELRKLNGLMQKQIDLLTSGKVRVVVVERAAEEKAEGRKAGT